MNIYNTLTHKIEKFVPNEPGKVSMYTCGPTVYHYAHIGNLRSYIMEDVLEKYLRYDGYDVKRVMNITDVGHLTSDGDTGDDKMLKGAKREHKTVMEIAKFYTDAFFEDCKKLNIKRPDVVEPATGCISDFIKVISALMDKGYAYEAGGNIYFDTSKLKEYYVFHNFNEEDLEVGVREGVEEDTNKRNKADFVLWFTKSKFDDQELKWDSPWGVGYPGWHIECSCISMKHLGERLDIHCGGIDNAFPHHTNEIAQSEAYLGHKWCNYWFHILHLNTNSGKMSKSKGNAVDPFEALAKYGADAIRWYFYTNSAPWLPNKFHDKGVTEGQRKLMGTIWNTYAFYVLYAEIDQFDPTKHEIEYDKLSVMDKWLLSKMNSMIKAADDNLNNYRIPEAAKAMQEFVDDLSNWYVRRGRERYWAQGMSQDKINAYMTLYTAIVTLCKCAAPMVPFITEEIYQNLVRSVDKDAPESIHLCDYPVCDENMIDEKLESDMEEVLEIVVLGRSARNGASLKNRQPLSVMYVAADHPLDSYYIDIIRDELNLKDVQFSNDVSAYIDYKFKPQLKTLGPKYGKQLGEIRTQLSQLDGHKAMGELNETGSLKLTLSSGEIALDKDDVLIESEQKEGFYTLSENGVTVAISTVLTPELIEEGFVREVISKVQTMRKDSGFEVMDHITVSVSGSEKVMAVVDKNREAISHDVLADDIVLGENVGNEKDWDINGEKVSIGVKKN